MTKPLTWAVSFLASLVSACGAQPATPDAPTQPQAFHNTRLTYALLTDDEETLKKDFQMKIRPTWVERTMAGVGLVAASGMEAVTWPVFAAFRSYMESNPEPSTPEYISETGVPHKP